MEILSLLRNKSAPLPTSHPTPGPPYSMGGVRWERVATLKLVPIKLSQILTNNIDNRGEMDWSQNYEVLQTYSNMQNSMVL